MNIKRIITTGITLAILSTSIFAASANTFTPSGSNRPGKVFVNEQSGYSYPTFNNFRYTGNDAISKKYDKAGPARNHDEREFMLVRKCDNETCDDNLLTDKINTIKEGDLLEFELYFHNNAEDPYDDGGATSSPDASNVNIGIDISNPKNPIGFIYSPDNQYRTNENDSKSKIEYTYGDYIFENAKVGDIARTASDDVLLNVPDGYELEFYTDSKGSKNWSVLYMAYEQKTADQEKNDPDPFAADNLHTYYFNKVPTNETSIKIDTAKPAQTLQTKIKNGTDKQKIVWFDKLPGCFRYNGYVSFRARVVKKAGPNICKELGAAQPFKVPADEVKLLTGLEIKDPMYRISLNKLKFEETYPPANTQIKWSSSDPNGSFWVPGFFGGISKIGKNEYSQFADPTPFKNNIYYTGASYNDEKINISIDGIDADLANPEVCKAEVTIPKLPVINKCESFATDVPTKLIPADAKNITGLDDINSMYKITISDLTFKEGYLPGETNIIWQSTDPKGIFYFEKFKGVYKTANSNKLVTDLNNVFNENEVYYIANSYNDEKVTVTIGGLSDEIANPSVCKAISMSIPKLIKEETPNICKEVKFDTIKQLSSNEAIKITKKQDPRPTFALKFDKFKFTELNPPKDTKIKWKSSDPKGIFHFEGTTSQGEMELSYAEFRNKGILHYESRQSTDEAVRVEITNLPKELLNPLECSDVIKIPIIPVDPVKPVCTNIGVNAPSIIYENRISEFTAKALDQDKETFNSNITYSVDKGYGMFFKQKPKDPADNKSSINIEFDNSKLPHAPEGGFCADTDSTSEKEGDKITAKPGEKVYFVGTKAGKNVITVMSNCTKEKVCTKSFDVTALTPEPPETECKNSELIAYTGEDQKGSQVQCLKQSSHGFMAKFYEDAAKTKLIPSTKIKVQWTSTDPHGIFIEPIDILLGKKGTEGKYIGGSIVIYFGSGNVNGHLYSIDGKVYAGPKCELAIKQCPEEINKCSGLGATITPAEPIIAGKDILITLNPVDTAGNPLPFTTVYKFKNTAGGTFPGSSGDTLYTNNPGTEFKGATKEGKIEIEMATKIDPAYSSFCKASFDVKTEVLPPEEVTCNNLVAEIKQYPVGDTIVKLEPNSIYNIDADATFSKTQDGEITYEINEKYGTLLNLQSLAPTQLEARLGEIKMKLSTTNGISKSELEKLVGKDTLFSKQTLKDAKSAYLVTYKDVVDPLNQNVFDIKVKGFDNASCQKFYSLKIPDVPVIPPVPPVETQCKTLAINMQGSGKFNPALTSTVLELVGDYKGHKGEISVEVQGTGTLSKANSPTKTALITFSNAEIQAGTLQFVYNGDNNYKDKIVNIFAKVINPETSDNTCKSELKYSPVIDQLTCTDLEIINHGSSWKNDEKDKKVFQVKATTSPYGKENELYYHWNVTDGSGEFTKNNGTGRTTNILENYDGGTKFTVKATTNLYSNDPNGCSANLRIKGETTPDIEEPEISKFVYAETNHKNGTDLLNTAHITPFFTYKIVYDAKSSNTNTVNINEASLKGGKLQGYLGKKAGGNLEVKDIRINITPSNKKAYTILKTPSYVNDPNDKTFNRDDADFNKIDDYEKKYLCKKTNNVCIDGDFETAIARFKDGKSIEFKNVEDDTKIEIKIQVTNKTKINDQLCETLPAENGCGEEFPNNVNFTAGQFKGNDRAKVVVICPYILTRQSGDVFFHSALDTGVDVAKCSKVKGATGPGIKATPVEKQKTPSTGRGKIADLPMSLNLPSHDVCRYSNLEKNLDGYDNVLKNFSSTICEFSTETGEALQEPEINKAIAANIKRIARWEGNLNGKDKIKTISELGNDSSIGNKSSGVYVKTNGNLEIEISEGIGEYNGIPAAQTYIVKDHNLIINSDITYGRSDFLNQKSIPSVAFIVINGDILIKNNVKTLNGVYMAVDLNNKGKGKIKNIDGKPTTNRLTVNGSLIGDVYELFRTRIGAGDPTKDEGAITIKYDERILLNTPAGLGSLVNVNQTLVPN